MEEEEEECGCSGGGERKGVEEDGEVGGGSFAV